MAAASELVVRSSTGRYEVLIGEGLFAGAGAAAPVIADVCFRDRLGDGALFVEAVESAKTLGTCERLIEELRDGGTARGDELLAVGGGIVQDVATLAASLYMRGIAWTYVPTTLLAMADSCIGGKSSINVGPYKNLAGNFHPPRRVLVDPSFLATLGDEAIAGGLCEAMKISFCRGPESFARYLELHDRFATEPEALLEHVLAAKTWFVETDEFDRAERRQLNFGHTFGHALEAATDYAVAHGIAVGVGVLAAERLAVALDGPGAAQPELAGHAARLVRAAAPLPPPDPARFEAAFRADKKHGRDGLHVILPVAGGATAERVLPDDAATMARVRAALDEALGQVAP